MTMTLDELRQFRLLRPEKFDVHLIDVLLRDDPSLTDPAFWGDAINHLANGRRRWLRGAVALPHIMTAWVKADLAYERLFQQPCSFGLEELKRALPLRDREVERAYSKRRRALQFLHSSDELNRLAHRWLHDAAESLLATLNGTVEDAKAHLRSADA